MPLSLPSTTPLTTSNLSLSKVLEQSGSVLGDCHTPEDRVHEVPALLWEAVDIRGVFMSVLYLHRRKKLPKDRI